MKINLEKFFATDKEYLEIGPLDNPRLKRPNYNVSYLDYNDTKTVKSLYKNSYARMDKIVDIDYPTYGRSYKEATNGRLFDGVYSAHMIEHSHDLIGHFLDVANVLKEGGRYVLVCPDKTHYADCFRQETTFREVYGAYMKNLAYLQGAVADACLNVQYYYDTSDFHEGKVSFLKNILCDNERLNGIELVYRSRDPLSMAPMCHIWNFSYTRIMEILRDCIRLKLIPFYIEEHECTSNGSNYNIYLVLKKCSDVITNEDMRLREIIKLQADIEKEKGLKSPLLYLMNNTNDKNVFIYGAGRYGKRIYNWLKEQGKQVSLVISDDGVGDTENGKYIINKISNINLSDENIFFVIAVMEEKTKKEIESTLNNLALEEWKHYVCV